MLAASSGGGSARDGLHIEWLAQLFEYEIPVVWTKRHLVHFAKIAACSLLSTCPSALAAAIIARSRRCASAAGRNAQLREWRFDGGGRSGGRGGGGRATRLPLP